ncbi:MAG: pyruvate kinase [Candidatus Bathyarchaeota archaeon]|nr:MAG: pyruvate kinase [Candidatus Bathyarchaeota archaeon]
MKKTKILCTLGPASRSLKMLRRMYKAGMNGVRINTAFGNFDDYKGMIRNVRKLGDIPVLLDLKGPEIRVKLEKKMYTKKDDLIEIGKERPIEFNYNIYNQLNIGDNVLINNGKLLTHIVKSEKNYVQLVIERGGTIEDGVGVNIPGKKLHVPSVSEKDLRAINFAKENNVEFVALSFVRGKQDISNFKGFAYNLQAEIVAKIENHQGVENFEEILREVDSIMIARGDLGVEMDLERIPLIQKHMIQRSNQEGKLVITATEILESMINNSIPTRAEISDIANAILDGTDVLMLSGETAIGRYPVESVSAITKTAVQVENSIGTNIKEEEFHNISRTVSRSIWQIAETMPLDKVVTMTKTGYTAKVITRFRLNQPIFAITANSIVKNQLELYYGVQPIQYNYEKEKDRILSVAQLLSNNNVLKEDDNVLFTAGVRTNKAHASNLIEIHTIGELLEFGKVK